MTEKQSPSGVIGSEALALSMKRNRNSESFIFLVSTPDTDIMAEAPEEVIGVEKSQGNCRLVVMTVSKEEADAGG